MTTDDRYAWSDGPVDPPVVTMHDKQNPERAHMFDLTGDPQNWLIRRINSDERPFAIINPRGPFGDEIVVGFLSKPDAHRIVNAVQAHPVLA